MAETVLFDQENLLPGQIGKVKFLWDGVEESGGLKTVIHEFVNSNNRFVESLGILNDTFTVSAILAGANYQQQLIQLKKVMKTPDEVVFKHPFEGDKNVFPIGYNVTQNDKTLGQATIRLELSEVPLPSQGNATQPTSAGITIASLSAQADALTGTFEKSISDVLDITKNSNFKKLQEVLDKAGSAFNTVFTTVDAVVGSLSVVKNEIDQFTNNITRLMNVPELLMNSITGVFNSLVELAATPEAALAMLSKLFSFGDTVDQTDEFGVLGDLIAPLNPIVQVRPDTTTAITRQQNQNAIKTFMQTSALVKAYVAAAKIDFSGTAAVETGADIIGASITATATAIGPLGTVESVDAVTSVLNDQFNKIFTQIQTGEPNNDTFIFMDSETLSKLLALRDDFSVFMEQVRLAAFDVDTIKTQPQTVQTLTYQYYGNTDKRNLLIGLNTVGNAADIKGDFEILIDD